jgi:cobalt-zinc-cadmium efflux system outer membrane protein
MVDTASARAAERQAGAMANPTVLAEYERTTRDDQSNAVSTVRLVQPLDIWGARGARRDAGALRTLAAEAVLAAVEARLETETVRAWTAAVATAQRVALTGRVMAIFDTALRISEQRLAAGDVSGYSHRRLALEAARYAAEQAEAVLAGEAARRTLLMLLADTSGAAPAFRLPDSLVIQPFIPSPDRFSTVSDRPDIRAVALEAEAMRALATAYARDRIPVPAIVGGYKAETMLGETGAWTGFIAGLSLPVPLWDRRSAGQASADAAGEAANWRVAEVRRAAERELAVAIEAVRTIEVQAEQLGGRLGPESGAALGALQAAWTEGEISLLEWLDGARAWHEAWAMFLTLQAERLVRRAVLAQAAGLRVADLPMEAP